ncbi:MAG: hypothetical protein A2855_00990 [Candidatus Liptonbacteria bacterium RIFCSPHIGHO2_01_FULL_57_28]|uniref:DUF1653 domain-containing protein n=1 Tax=Candidatus Liptonbacteria bacterium RIFCSPHIGHO2_01_FULL_57_28 TaxID=1798647 RepID=A0A1G2CCE5_9BACT|nr:MAG: hypothetical protein A2855_00990 [Candidatus Liptonbacteria bacterium RIFCSPHIGHO2_01_FULL_57_28]
MAGMRAGIYRHYKGGLYQVLGTARHSETLEEMVLYKHLGADGAPAGEYWIRPRAMFLEEVEVGGKKMPRFEFLRDHA